MKVRIIKIAVVVAIALILLWRFWPHPIFKWLPDDIDSASKAMANVSISDIKNGKPRIDTYTMNEVNRDQLTEILGILDTSGYRRDWRNLVPWGLSSVSSGKKYDGRTLQIYIFFPVGDAEYGEDIAITYKGKDGVILYGKGIAGMRVYHPTNPETIDYLVGYLQANGVLQ